MIISHQNRFIFIRIGKTASTSIEIGLSAFCGGSDVITPLSREDEGIRRRLGYHGPQNFQRSLNSYTGKEWLRLIFKGKWAKDYRHAPAVQIQDIVGSQKWKDYFKFCFERNPYDRAISLYFWKTRNQPSRPNVNEFILAQPRYRLSNWEKYTINNEVAVDFVGKYENIEMDLLEVSSRLGLSKIDLVRSKNIYRPDRVHYSRILDARSRKYIESMCEREIDEFEYRWESD